MIGIGIGISKTSGNFLSNFSTIFHLGNTGFYKDIAGTSPATQSNDLIANWKDSHSNISFIQSTSSLRPTFQYDLLSCAKFDGIDDVLTSTLAQLPSYRIYAIGKWTGSIGATQALFAWGSGTVPTAWVGVLSGNFIGSGNAETDTLGPIGNSQIHLWELSIDSNCIGFIFDGGVVHNTKSASIPIGSTITIGNFPTLSAFWQGEVFEILISSIPKLEIRNYLISKYSLTSSQPSLSLWYLPSFSDESSGIQRMLISSDATNWTEQLTSFPRSSVDSAPSAGDYSIFQYQGHFYQAYTRSRDIASIETNFAINFSEDTQDWQSLALVDCSSISGVQKIWSPEYFLDQIGNSHFYFSSSTSSTYEASNFSIYEIHPLSSDLSGTYSTPTLLLSPSYIDPFVIFVNGFYFLWAKNEAVGQKLIEVYKSTSPTGPFTLHRSGDWMGIGSGVEGPSLRFINGVWRVWVDRYQSNTGMAYTEQTAGDWTGNGSTTWSSLITLNAPFVARHGTPVQIQ